MDTRFIRDLSIEDLLALAAAILSELGSRLRVNTPSSGVPVQDTRIPLLRPGHCGYICAFCDNPCSRGEEGHRHHKCRAHRRW